MLSKFSVRKPYTVVVGVILVLLLGLVSYTRMTTDLLPDMNLPYAIVLTSYPGASPSEVEETVTVPVEGAMATVSNIEEIQSISQENMSLVILQFSQSTDMDSVSLEMRENLDMIDGSWDDNVGSPIIMKLNPEMMPVMVAAVDKEDLDSIGISDYAADEIVPDLESIEGVASVSSSGDVEESIQVILREDKIEEVNERVKNAVRGEFDDAQEELDDARKELEDSKQKLADSKDELASGQSQLDAGKEALLNQLPAAESQLSEAQQELLSNKSDLEDNLSMINMVLVVLDESLADGGLLDQAQEQLDQAAAALDADALIAQLQAQKESLQTQIDGWEQELEENAAQQLQALPDDASKEQLEEIAQRLSGYIADAQDAIDEAETQIESLTASAASLLEQQDSISATRAELENQRQEMESSKELLEGYLQQIESGEVTLSEAVTALNQQKISATIEMSTAQTRLLLGEAQIQQGEAQLESGEEQLDSGQEQLDDQKEAALDSADVSSRLTVETISQILQAQNFSMPAGYVTENDTRYLVRVGDKFTDLEQIEDLVLFDTGLDDVAPIKLSEVADVVKTDNSSEIYASVNGHPGVLLTMQKQTGYPTSEVSNRLKSYFEKAQTQEDGLNFTILMDQGIYIDMVVAAVLKNLLYGAILAIIILYLFLRDIRPTVIVAFSIPISVLAAVVLMYFSGITLNIISLSGLALGVGMLVDNSIVVIENIYRLRALGYSRRKAAVAGAGQVAGAIIASTLTTICVFLPIIFTEGITRQLFVDMGLTIAYSLVASLFIALTLVPSMSSVILKKEKEIKHTLFDRLTKGYQRLMQTVLRFKVVTLMAALVLLILSAWLCISRGFTLIPDMESTQATVTVTLPDGADMEDTSNVSNEIMERLQEIEDIESIGAMAGSQSGLAVLGMSSGSSSDAGYVTMYLQTSEEKELSNEELEKEILERTEDLDCEVAVSTSSMDMSSLTGSGIQIDIKGRDLDKLQTIASDIAALIGEVPGTVDISDGLETAENEARIIVNKKKAADYNLTVAQVYQQIAAKIAQTSAATTLQTDVKDYDVDVMDEGSETYTREDVQEMQLTYTDTEGKTKKVALRDVADFADATGLASISRSEQSRYISVTAGVEDGYNVTKISDKISEKLKEYEVPDGFSVEMSGEDETIRETMSQLLKMMLLAVVLIYLIMVAQFQSLLSPFIVMFTIPLAFTGGFFGLLLTGKDFSIIAMIGFVMLCGIIVNNGIVLVDYINQLRADGKEKHAAIIEAGKTRMRPIMMTAMTTILGLTTMAFGVGMGADMMQGMAIVVIGGLIYGTLLTLFVVPCIYDLLNHKEYVMFDKEEKGDYDNAISPIGTEGE